MTLDGGPAVRDGSTRGSWFRRFAPRIALLLFGIVAGLVTAEALLRVTGLGAGRGGVSTVTSLQFERVPGIFEPGQDEAVDEKRELTYRVRIDTLGYRGNDFPRSKAADEFRILYVGDSFVFGDFVSDTQTLPAQLQHELAARCEGLVRVVNAGLGGSTITEEAEMIQRGMAIDPDLIILQFAENDLTDLAGTVQWEALARNREAKSRFPLSVLYPLLRRTALWKLATRTSAMLRARAVADALGDDRGKTGAADLSGPVADPRISALREEYRMRLAAARDTVARRGLPFVVTVFPSWRRVFGVVESDQLPWLEGVAQELELEVINFLPVLSADGRSETELYLEPYDGHASSEGYRVAAEHLSTRLSTIEVLTSRCH